MLWFIKKHVAFGHVQDTKIGYVFGNVSIGKEICNEMTFGFIFVNLMHVAHKRWLIYECLAEKRKEN